MNCKISKESKRTESACCAISEKAFGKETVLTASVPQKPIARSSAVCINIDQRALGNGTVGNNNDSPKYGIHTLTVGSSTSKMLKVSRGGKNNPPSYMVVDDIDKGSESSEDLETVFNGIQNAETTSSDNFRDDDEVKDQHGTLTLRFIEKSNGEMAGEKPRTVSSQQKSDQEPLLLK